MPTFPGGIWTPPSRGTNMSDATTHTDTHDAEQAEIVAIQTQLGANFGACVPWTGYTPALSGSGWAIGTGGSAAANGAYSVTNGTVDFYSQIRFGTSGANAGAVSPIVSLPVAAHADLGVMLDSIHVSIITNAGAHTAARGRILGSTFDVHVQTASGTYVSYAAASNSVPFAWAAGDRIFAVGRYRKA